MSSQIKVLNPKGPVSRPEARHVSTATTSKDPSLTNSTSANGTQPCRCHPTEFSDFVHYEQLSTMQKEDDKAAARKAKTKVKQAAKGLVRRLTAE